LLPSKTDIKNVTPEDLDGDSEEPSQSLALGKECELDQARVEEGRLGFAALELLNDTPEEHDVRSVEIYYDNTLRLSDSPFFTQELILHML
jgi:hypothetical protein